LGCAASKPLKAGGRKLTLNIYRKNNYACWLVFSFFFITCGHLFFPKEVFAGANCKKYTTVLIENRFDKSRSATIQAEVADEPDERALGLMNRKKLAKNMGMLFVYNKPSAPQFWMKNTLISLDIVFSDYEGRIIRIFENVPRMSEKKITAGNGVSFVLEINGGLMREFKIDSNWLLNLSDYVSSVEPYC
jgi:uncharacterized membrane protein (UPF0127 family)|tara:strand:+ start:1744 stop:2313 length:570 start_codon:yes stop_codon:yes gene_type:complete